MATGKTITTANPLDRMGMAMDATYEIESLCDALHDLMAAKWEPGTLAGRGMILRIKQLSCAIMDAIGNDEVPDSALNYTITGDGRCQDQNQPGEGHAA